MRKFLVALMALSLVSVAFSSCDNGMKSTADPVTQPIAGKTYREPTGTGDGYAQLTFHMNYKCTLVAKRDNQDPITNSNFERWMSPNDTEVVVRYAQGAYDTTTGMSLSGKTFLSGSYDATNKMVILSGDFDGQTVTYHRKEVE